MIVRNDVDPLDEDEVLRRIPEIKTIEDESIYASVVELFRYAPPAFWTAASSTSGKYHPPDERGKHGNWLHTRRCITIFNHLMDVELVEDRLTEFEADCGRAAILLHDLWKNGIVDRGETVDYHDVLAADLVRVHTDLPDQVADAIASHNGPWGHETSPEPESRLDQLVQRTDMIASRKEMTMSTQDDPHEHTVTKIKSCIKETATSLLNIRGEE